MSFGFTAIAGTALVGSIYSGRKAEKGAKRAAEAQERGQLASIEEQRAARQDFNERVQPFIDIGLSGQDELLAALGLTSRDELLARRERFERFERQPLALGARKLARIDKLLGFVPDIPDRPDLAALPAAPTAFDPSAVADNPIYDFLLEEGFRPIEERGAGGGRNVDRDLVRFAQGTAATLLPQLQQQQFQQQAGLRGQALAEQAGLRADALSEQQQRIGNLLSTLGIGQSSAVGAGNAGLQTAANIGTALGNIGSAQAQGALGAAQANQNMIGNILGGASILAGGLGGSSPALGTGGFTTQQALDPNLFNFSSRGLTG